MSTAIHDAHPEPKAYHYSNEALMLNEIVFGIRDSNVRDSATEEQLDAIASLEAHNATMIELGMDYPERKSKLIMFYNKGRPKGELGIM